MTILYNCHHDGDQYRITKFIDGNPEASYLLSHTECQCPAGHRPTCRHRQMLPQMLAERICNEPWFWHFESGKVVDFEGNSTIACHDFSAKDTEQDTLPAPGHTDLMISPEAIDEALERNPLPVKSWRRI